MQDHHHRTMPAILADYGPFLAGDADALVRVTYDFDPANLIV
jgi:hypothetical protein